MSENESDNAEVGPEGEGSSRALTATAETPASGQPSARLPMALSLVALALVLLISGGGGYLGWHVWQKLGAVEQRVGDASQQADEASQAAADAREAAVSPDELDKRAGRLASRIDELADRVATIREESGQRDVAKLRERVAALESARESLNQRMADVESIARTSKDEWKRSEAAYLATIAVHRLRYYRDVDAALGALKEAHALLEDFGGEQIEARKGIARAIDRLIEVDPPRLDRIRQRLAEFEDAVADLPVAGMSGDGEQDGDSESDQAPRMKGASWRERAGHAWGQFKGSLSQLVEVSREGEGPPLYTPSERFFLVQNLKLQIEKARLAAVRGDQTAYEASLERLRRWLNNHFAQGNDRVASLSKQAKELASMPVSVELPDIASLVERVRSLD